ncbi:MAG: hypothetical protein HGA60_05070 [Chlorobiaceae bacterium]|nr:hypothetical protein [Chlorobiaceae bacterium]
MKRLLAVPLFLSLLSTTACDPYYYRHDRDRRNHREEKMERNEHRDRYDRRTGDDRHNPYDEHKSDTYRQSNP